MPGVFSLRSGHIDSTRCDGNSLSSRIEEMQKGGRKEKMRYSISQGILTTDDGEVLLTGLYSGGDHGLRPDAVNNPALYKARPNVGPIPPATYTLGPLMHSQLGPAMSLTPLPGSNVFGASGLFAHYNNAKRDAGEAPYPPKPGRNSSDGCIVCVTPGGLAVVEAQRVAGDSEITVVAQFEEKA